VPGDAPRQSVHATIAADIMVLADGSSLAWSWRRAEGQSSADSPTRNPSPYTSLPPRYWPTTRVPTPITSRMSHSSLASPGAGRATG